MRTVNTEQLARAIEFGGYAQARRHYFKSTSPEAINNQGSDKALANSTPSDLEEACAIGQAALNLGVGPFALTIALMNFSLYDTKAMSEGNDNGRTLKQTARQVRKVFLGFVAELPEFDYGAIFNNYQGRKV